jgi:hypothetical protein
MKTHRALCFAIVVITLLPAAVRAQIVPTQSFVSTAFPITMDPDPPGADSADSKLYLDGTRAINESRWSDAIAIFTRVADQKSDHAAGALYWKAYAENKEGQASRALDTCTALRTQYSSSSWRDDCGALEIEIRASSGKPVVPNTEQSDDLKLLALNSLLQRDEARARAQIADILAGDSSEQLKEGALFLLGRSVPESTYPQIVRISTLDGDVRVARASQNEKAKDATWEQAAINLPLYAGDSIVTGDGRAEIEFENASTIYLGPNSVLSCYDLHTTSGVPHTELSLLSGTVIMNLLTLMPGETFTVHTPTDSLVTRYPQGARLRLSSYVDGIAITSLAGGSLSLPSASRQALTSGQTVFFHNGARIAPIAGDHDQDFAAFDKWASDTYASRSTATHDVMQAAGLTAPIPGLAEMKDKGSFFDCAPYGTCWEPHASPEAHDAPAQQARTAAPQKKPSTAVSGIAPTLLSIPDEGFPCLPSALRYWYLKDPATGQTSYAGAGFESGASAYGWAVCHSGSWIYQNQHYVWVAGTKRHHNDPLRWVKSGSTVAYVPIHPRDVKGQLPLNHEHGLIAARDKDGFTLRQADLGSAPRLELMKSPPREFRSERTPVLARAEAPHMEAHTLNHTVAANGAPSRPTAIPLRFDHRAQSFLMPHQVVQGNHNVTVFTPLGNQGVSGNRSGGIGGSPGQGANFNAGNTRNGTNNGGTHSSGNNGGGHSNSNSGGSHSGATPSSSAAPSTAISVSSSGAAAPSTAAHH